MALTTTPTYAAVDVDTQESSSLRSVLLQTRYVHDIAMPTLKVFWQNRQTIKLGPDKKIRGNMFHGLANAWLSNGGSLNFPTEVKDNLTQVSYDIARVGSSTAISDEDKLDYGGDNSLYDLAEGRTSEVHGGMTHAANYLLWSGMGVRTTEVSGGEINLDSFMNNTPGIKITGDTEDISNRWGSIPLAIRAETAADGSAGTNTQHTYGNIKTDTPAWNARINTLGSGVTYGTAGGDNEKGILTDAGITGAAITEAMITDLLDEMQIGDDYFLYMAMPSKIYSAIARILQSQIRGTPENPVYDLGINRAILYKSYNTVLYAEPALDHASMWPNSIWCYDPRHLFLAITEGFGPIVYPWQRIGFSTDMGFAEYIRGQIVCTNRRAVGAIHGVA